MIYRGFPQILSGYSNNVYVKLFISGQLILYLIPLLLLLRPEKNFIKLFFKFSYILSLVYLFLFLPISFSIGINADIYHFLEQSAYYFAAPAGMILLTLPYHSTKVKVVSILTIIISLVIMAYLARRSSFAYYGGILCFSFLLINFSFSPVVNRTRLLSLIFTTIIMVSGLILLFLNLDKFSYFFDKSQHGFTNREMVFLEFFVDMEKNPNDWIIGRGINGTFKSVSLGYLKNKARDGIENGYLQAILKGGYVYIGLIVLLSLGAMLNGFFKSENLLCKGFASYILIFLVEMIGFGLPTLSVKYLFFWLAIVSCYYKPILYDYDYKLKTDVGLG